MKKVIIALGILFLCGGLQAQIVNNSGSTAADSIPLPFYLLDSNGYNTVLLATTDTVFLVIFRPNGVIAFEDSIAHGTARISDNNVSTNIGQYALKLAVADIDGAGADGVFSYTIITDDESLDLETVCRGTFQLYQNSDFNVWATRLQDSTQAIIDSLQIWGTRVKDSLQAVLDSLQTTAHNNQAEAWDGDDVGTKLRLTQLKVVATPAEDTAVIFRSTGLSTGLFIWSDSSDGALFQGSALAGLGNGFRSIGGAGGGHGVRFSGGPGGSGMELNEGPGSGNALTLVKASGTYINIETRRELASTISDSVWDISALTAFASGSMGDSAIGGINTWGQAGGSGLDSATTSRILHRIGWGTSKSAGSDSSTLAERDATTGAAGTDTTNIKTMLYNNPVIASGKQVAYYGRVNNAAPTTTRFIPAGLGGTINAFDLTRSDDFYNDMTLKFVSGSLKGQRTRITDWKTTPDSLFIESIFGLAPANNDSFIVEEPLVLTGGWTDSNKTEQGGIIGANRTWSVYVFDTSGTDSPIPNADVDVQLTNGTVKLRGTTVASGLVTFTVTDGSWVLVSQETGYVLNSLPKTISANSTDTVKGYDVPIGAPASPALCRVFGYVYSIGAVPDEGAGVAAFLPAGVARSGNLIISPFTVSTITDSLGYFYLDLIRSDSLIPAGTLYDLIINRKDGTIAHKRIMVPNQSSWLINW